MTLRRFTRAYNTHTYTQSGMPHNCSSKDLKTDCRDQRKITAIGSSHLLKCTNTYVVLHVAHIIILLHSMYVLKSQMIGTFFFFSLFLLVVHFGWFSRSRRLPLTDDTELKRHKLANSRNILELAFSIIIDTNRQHLIT